MKKSGTTAGFPCRCSALFSVKWSDFSTLSGQTGEKVSSAAKCLLSELAEQQFPDRRIIILKPESLQAGLTGTLNIMRHIINKQAFLRPKMIFANEIIKNLPVGLEHMDIS